MSSGGSMSKTELPPFRIAVIGGGITGLAAAYRLQNRMPLSGREFKIHLLEGTDRVGGIVRTLKQDGFLLECGPDSFITQKRRGVGLCDDIGMRRHLMQTQTKHARSFISKGKKLIPIPDGFYLIGPTRPIPFLFSSIISLKGKLRMLKEPWIPVRPGPPGDNENYDESLGSFVRRRLGVEALERIAQPLVSGIYSADPETLSLRATFPQFLAMEKRSGVLRGLMNSTRPGMKDASGARYNLFATLRDGMQSMTDHLAKQLAPGVITLNTMVRSLSVTKEGRSAVWHITMENGETMDADAICSALPAYATAFLLQGIDSKLAQLLNSVIYTDSATLQMGFKLTDIKHPLDGFGFVVPTVEKRFISACTFSHRKFEGRAPAGHALLRVYVGGATFARFRGEDSELQSKSLADLRDLLGVKGKPLFGIVARYRRALPQFSVGHRQRLAEIRDRVRQIPGLTIAGNYMEGVGLPDCIESAEASADAIMNYIAR